jgi:hypothetical protein
MVEASAWGFPPMISTPSIGAIASTGGHTLPGVASFSEP